MAEGTPVADTPLDARTTTLVQTIGRLLLGVALLFAGIAHLTGARREFQAQVPDWLPLPADTVVVASGIVELALGAALIVLSRHRRSRLGGRGLLRGDCSRQHRSVRQPD
ncbi:DoxX family membrane protein [Deinococcus malanensis]|uniref:DoxX family protein n=1 Tax=Deinococcus malanensis TaxID=1706855 RepID=UPI00363F10B6